MFDGVICIFSDENQNYFTPKPVKQVITRLNNFYNDSEQV